MCMRPVDILKVANRRFCANIETMQLVICFQNVNFHITKLPLRLFNGRNNDHRVRAVENMRSEISRPLKALNLIVLQTCGAYLL